MESGFWNGTFLSSAEIMKLQERAANFPEMNRLLVIESNMRKEKNLPIELVSMALTQEAYNFATNNEGGYKFDRIASDEIVFPIYGIYKRRLEEYRKNIRRYASGIIRKMPEILRCPHCGSECKIVYEEIQNDYCVLIFVSCETCGCRTVGYETNVTGEHECAVKFTDAVRFSIEDWNRRMRQNEAGV